MRWEHIRNCWRLAEFTSNSINCNTKSKKRPSPFCQIALQAKKPPVATFPAILETLGDHIRKRQIELQLRPKEVARILGVSIDTIYRWRRKQWRPSIRRKGKIIQFLGYNPFPETAVSLGEKIRNYRATHELTIGELAAALGVTKGTIHSLEKNKHKPRKRLAERLAAIC